MKTEAEAWLDLIDDLKLKPVTLSHYVLESSELSCQGAWPCIL